MPASTKVEKHVKVAKSAGVLENLCLHLLEELVPALARRKLVKLQRTCISPTTAERSNGFPSGGCLIEN